MCCYGQLVTSLMQLDLSVSLFSICSGQFSPFSRVHLFATPWAAAFQASLINLVMPSCHPNISSCLPLLFLPSIFPNIRLFSSESVLPIRWANNQSFKFSIRPSSEYSGLIFLFFFSFLSFFLSFFFFRIDWLDLLAVQGTLNSLLQHHSLKGIYVCHLSVMSYSPCWDLTTRTECKQHAKMRIKSQCSI